MPFQPFITADIGPGMPPATIINNLSGFFTEGTKKSSSSGSASIDQDFIRDAV